jgi:hypothetical protein
MICASSDSQLVGMHAFDRALGAHGHEDGRLHHAMRRLQPAPAGGGGGVSGEEFKHQF